MKNQTILILDDEVLATEYLKEILDEEKTKYKELKHFNVLESNSYNDFFIKLEATTPSIVFLDIHMQGKNGIEVANIINKSYKDRYQDDALPIIVFITAYDNFGYKAFQVNAFDYILKPIGQESISNLLQKIINKHNNVFQKDSEFINIDLSGINVQVPIKDIIYFKADMKYITVKTEKKSFLINDTLINLEKKYPYFIKIHRSSLINPQYIYSFLKKENSIYVCLKDNTTILPISRRQKSEIERKINFQNLF